MTMYEMIKNLRKDYVFDQYVKIAENPRGYEKITKTKMLHAIYDVYSDYNNIIEICTTRELKYLDLVLYKQLKISETANNSKDLDDPKDEKYCWERENLRNKFLFDDNMNHTLVPEEIIDNVKEAIKQINWKEKKKKDPLNEIVIGFCKAQGSTLLEIIPSIASPMTNISEQEICRHMITDKMFNFYVAIVLRSFESIEDEIPVGIYYDYYEIEDDLDYQRSIQGVVGIKEPDAQKYKNLFYNDFDITNPKIRKFVDEMKKTELLKILC